MVAQQGAGGRDVEVSAMTWAEEQLFAGIREMVYRRSLPLATRKLQIVATKLDTRSGLVGLALPLADGIFAPDRVGALISRV
ncbi:hypothetical protein [Couchioplanes azureus]|uniref:hypothetical protein n=1 Tax=Couchioplanes caeruleus TaxID=56438 RepID=UPI001988EBB4|nr:hypothetical protein [Couchioplanes caeruleus]GGQ62319.1 hypothetical protein GCM10010166_35130 [Couchioplanes caeruleus subsp. azureus]